MDKRFEMIEGISEYFAEFENEVSLGAKSQHSLRSYEKFVGDFISYFNIQSIEDIKKKVNQKSIREYRSSISGVVISTINARFRVLKALFNWLVDNEYIRNNPIDRMKAIKEVKKPIFFLTEEEQDKMIAACKTIQEKAIMVFMFGTGVRRNELVNLKLSDITDNHVAIKGKGNKTRVVLLVDDVCEVLNDYLNSRKDDSEYLFVSSRGSHQITGEAVRLIVKKIAANSDIDPKKADKIHPHISRKSFASTLVNKGVDMAIVQKLLGHSSILTTISAYGNVSNEVMDRAMRK
jgi:site-specific recombinase XerD